MALAQRSKLTRTRRILFLISVSAILMLSVVLAVVLNQKRSKDQVIFQQQTQQAQLDEQDEKLRQERLQRENAEKRLEKERDDAEKQLVTQKLEAKALQDKLENEREERSNAERELSTQKSDIIKLQNHHNLEIERIHRESEAAKQSVIQASNSSAETLKSASSKTNTSKLAPSPWVFADSSQRRLTATDLTGINEDQLWRARNEIYARGGYIFTTPRGRQLTASLGASYRGSDDNLERVHARLNEVEKDNVNYISNFSKPGKAAMPTSQGLKTFVETWLAHQRVNNATT